MSEMVLLGAGASYEAGVPLAFEMSRKMLEGFGRSYGDSQYKILTFVIGGLLFQRGRNGSDPYEGVNVEDLFNAVQLLANRNDLEVAPFVGSWHEMVERFDKIKPPVTRLDLDRISTDIVSSIQSGSRFGATGELRAVLEKLTRKILDAVEGQQPVDGGGQVFRQTNESMIRALKNFVWIDTDDRVQYLKPLLHLFSNQKRLVIVTLNYDNSVELLCHSAGVECHLGLDDFSKGSAFDIAADNFYLLKLHGSIDWAQGYEHPQRIVFNPTTKQREVRPLPKGAMPRYVIRQIASNRIQREDYNPAVIFGQRNKLTTEGPFLDLLRLFKQELSAADELTIIGYSFRDSHINEYLWQWLNGSSDHRIRIIDPGLQRSSRGRPNRLQSEYGQLSGSEYVDELLNWCGDRIQVMKAPASSGLEKAFGNRPA